MYANPRDLTISGSVCVHMLDVSNTLWDADIIYIQNLSKISFFLHFLSLFYNSDFGIWFYTKFWSIWKKSSSKTHHFSRFFTTFLLFYIHWIKWCDIPAVPPWCPCLVMSPPLPGGGMVDHQFEPHIILILCVIQIGRLPYPLLAKAGTSQGITRAGTPRGNGGDITSFDSNVCRIIEKWWKIVKNYAFLMNFFLK